MKTNDFVLTYGPSFENEEIELKDQLHFINQVASTIPDILCVMKLDTNELIYSNRDVFEVLGRSYKEVSAMSPEAQMQMCHPDDRLSVKDYFDKLKNCPDDHMESVEYRYAHINGEWLWFKARGKVFKRDKKGRPTHCLSLVQNISQLKEAELQLKQVNEDLLRQRTLLAEAETIGMMGSWEKDVRTGKLIWSDELFRTFGLQPQSIKVSSEFYIDNFVHPEDRRPVYENLQALYNHQVEQPIEYRVRTGNGEKIVYCKPHVVRNSDGQIHVVRGIVRDVTSQKKAESDLVDLKLAQQKELLNAVLMGQEQERIRIGEGLHNGVGQLLYAALVKTELLEVDMNRSNVSVADIKAVLKEAIEETRSISFQLIPTILKDHGLMEALGALLKRIGKSGLQINLNAGEANYRFSESAEIGIYRIVQELLNNIIKHSNASSASIDITLVKGRIKVTVADNGIGFDLKKVNQLHKGIGLQSIRNRAKLMDAELHIESAPSKGTTVFLDIPS